jgi:hypothetical protein
MGQDKLKAYYAREAASRQSLEEQAAALVAAGRHDEAERLVVAANLDIQGGLLLARVFRARLEAMVGAGAVGRDRAAAEEVFRRALDWAQRSYPEPHTQCEADDYRAGRAEDLARMVKVLGHDPSSPR